MPQTAVSFCGPALLCCRASMGGAGPSVRNAGPAGSTANVTDMAVAAQIDSADIFFEMPLNKWPLFVSKALSPAKVVLLHDLKPLVDMFNATGVGVGIRTASEAVAELKLSTKDRQRLVA